MNGSVTKKHGSNKVLRLKVALGETRLRGVFAAGT